MTRLHPAVALDDLARPRRRKRRKLLSRARRLEGRASREPVLQPVPAAPWGPAVRMGNHLRVQAAVGHRAAVISLRPGLYLVAELPEEAMRPEFGVLPLLAPMIVKAATNTLMPTAQAVHTAPAAHPLHAAQPVARPPGGGLVSALAPVARAALALPGPVAPALPAPVDWADDELVAEVMGCDACQGRCGR